MCQTCWAGRGLTNIVEKLQNRFLKYILGVNIKSTNWAVRSEMGRIPLTIKIYESIIKYHQHICTGSISGE